MPENPDFGCGGGGCAAAGFVAGRCGGGGRLFDDDGAGAPERGGIDGFLGAEAPAAAAGGAGSLHAEFTSLISQLFVE